MISRPTPEVLRAVALSLAAGVARVAAAIVLSALVTIVLIHLIGGNIRLALWSLWDGAFGSPYNLGSTVVAATPLILTGLGISIAFQCRMWNIGGESQFLVGCLASSALALNCPFMHRLPVPLELCFMLTGSVVAGALWAGLAALLKAWRDVPEVISTIMLNFIAAYLLLYLVGGPMERLDRSQPATDMLPPELMLTHLNVLMPSLFAPSPLNTGIGFALVCVVLVYVLMNFSRFGFSIKLVGANTDAARLTGIPVKATLVMAMVLSGALCGLAGGIELSGRVGFIPENYSPGYGFEAIAVALLGRLSPIGVIFAAAFIGALSVGCQNMERTAGIAHEMGLIIQAVALLSLLATQWSGWSAYLPRQLALMLS